MLINKNNTKHIKEVIKAYLNQNNVEQGLVKHQVVKEWELIVGKRINSVTTNIYIEKNLLFVSIKSPIIRSELKMIKSAIVERINAKAGFDIITDIIIR
jgi:hypothetical protein